MSLDQIDVVLVNIKQTVYQGVNKMSDKSKGIDDVIINLNLFRTLKKDRETIDSFVANELPLAMEYISGMLEMLEKIVYEDSQIVTKINDDGKPVFYAEPSTLAWRVSEYLDSIGYETTVPDAVKLEPALSQESSILHGNVMPTKTIDRTSF